MQFLDKTKITVKAGNGGNGCVAFHREKYVSRGGPSGGNGGKGGSIVFRADPGMSTLIDFKYKHRYFAQDGEAGLPEMRSGKDGADLLIQVPVGTVIRDVETGAVVADMNEPGKTKVLLKGGRGGYGNSRFATPTRQSPRFAQDGQKMKEREFILELKTIADVGLIGLPSVGKSTILSVLTSAKPKIAAYHFTTLTPNLGVAEWKGKSFVIADIPGLIEGAAEGAGLGHDFLKHIERTRILIHVLDASGSEGRDPVDDYEKINAELYKFSTRLAGLPQIVALNKTDLISSHEQIERLGNLLTERNAESFPVSAATAEGFGPLLDRVVEMLGELPPVLEYPEEEIEVGPTYEKGFTVTIRDDGVYVVDGGDVQKLLDETDPYDEDSMRRFQMVLVKSGMIAALREIGAKDGDTVSMGGWEFDFTE